MTEPAPEAPHNSINETRFKKMASTVDEVQVPILSELEKKELADKVEIEFVTPAMQLMVPIKLIVSRKLTLK